MKWVCVTRGATFAVGLSLAISAELVGQTETKNAQTAHVMKAPVAKKEIKIFDEHGQQRQDEYYWMRQRENPDVIAYLKAENDYTKQALAATHR